uniref:Uncharacterized protein n=1 Tax=Arundo donax TaxID=35708 RepID=A0A0A8ZAL1_ARUDO
MLLFPLNF